MKPNPFLPRFEDLPAELPLFPLSGAVVMPGVQLPLNIFEPRYLRMVDYALATQHLIGMVQPRLTEQNGDLIYQVGCGGRITSYTETHDGRIVLVLTGFCRFEVIQELQTPQDFRRAQVSWQRFSSDYNAPSALADREQLLSSLRSYCTRHHVEVPWDDIAKMVDSELVNLLCTHLPLDVDDKQALVETVDLSERATLMCGLMDMSALAGNATTQLRH